MFRERSLALGIAAPALVLVGLATAASAAPRVRPFDGQFRDTPCGSPRAGELKLCGTGTIRNFGSVTSTVLLRRTAVNTIPGCATYTGTRTLTFAKEKSKLRLAIRGPSCATRTWGRFTIVTGTGVFSNAKGQGVIWGTPFRVRYFGVLMLRK